MKEDKDPNTRRTFLKQSGLLAAGLISLPAMGLASSSSLPRKKSLYMIGPQEGYTPAIGTLLSTMTMMRQWVIDTVENLSVAELDFQLDDQSNSIGAMLMHLAATERYYQLNTFDKIPWGEWSEEISAEWDTGSHLGENARKKIKGNKIGYYLKKLKEVRDITEAEFAKRDDSWLQEAEPFFSNEMTNNHCKWFHVCEHESNHRGQMKLIIKRIPKK